jgi:electron transfer flavoprotein alpha subunit
MDTQITNPVVVLIETMPDGTPRSTAAGLIGAAALVGTPVAVAITAPGVGADLPAALGHLGAQHVFRGEAEAAASQLGVAQTAALAEAVAHFGPVAVLVANTAESAAVAGRLAIRVNGAVCADAVGLRFTDGEVIAQHFVFGGDYTTESTVDGGPLIITIRSGAIANRAAPVDSPAVTAADGGQHRNRCHHCAHVHAAAASEDRPALMPLRPLFPVAAGWVRWKDSPLPSNWPMNSVLPSAPPVRRLMPATRPRIVKWGRPEPPFLRISISRWASRGPSSIKLA